MADSKEKVDKEIKIVVVGDGAVGKTCLISCYVNNSFPAEHVPTVFDAHRGQINFKDQARKIIIWDTAGQEDLNDVRKLAYDGTDCFIVCFNLASKTSLDNVKNCWKAELNREGCKSAPKILVGTKSDLRDEKEDKSECVTD